MTITATLTDRAPKFTTSHRKEQAGLHKCYAMLIPSSYNPGEAHAIAELRIYWPADTCYACLWVNPRNDQPSRSGSGRAGGGGYCKMSGAADAAIFAAGFNLSHSIHGIGEEAIRAAMKAIAAAIGHPEAILFEIHP